MTLKALPDGDPSRLKWTAEKPYFVIVNGNQYCGGFATSSAAHTAARRWQDQAEVIRRVKVLPQVCRHVRV